MVLTVEPTSNCHRLDQSLILRDDSGSELVLQAKGLTLTGSDLQLTEVRLQAQTRLDQLQQIKDQAFLNLRSEVCGPLPPFQPDHPIMIEASLDPALLPQLSQALQDQPASEYLQTLQTENPDHPLLSTHSWYGLRITQIQDQDTLTYSSLWAYLSPATLMQGSQEAIGVALTEYAKSLSALGSPPIDQERSDLQNQLETILTDLSQRAEQTLSSVTDQLNQVLTDLAQSTEEAKDPMSSFVETLCQFFQSQNWPYQQIEMDPPLLRLIFSGHNGTWNCYVKLTSLAGQVIFYSICPVEVPESQRLRMSEFLTRANWGLIQGNFEMDWDTGNIRFKTSLDTQGSALTFNLCEPIIFSNVLIVDQYLLGIKALLEEPLSPMEALEKVEEDRNEYV